MARTGVETCARRRAAAPCHPPVPPRPVNYEWLSPREWTCPLQAAEGISPDGAADTRLLGVGLLCLAIITSSLVETAIRHRRILHSRRCRHRISRASPSPGCGPTLPPTAAHTRAPRFLAALWDLLPPFTCAPPSCDCWWSPWLPNYPGPFGWGPASHHNPTPPTMPIPSPAVELASLRWPPCPAARL